ncbi:hypothetical protein ASF66_00975 [Pseudomonas sp. Leaf129]|uniref:hypothetical protein n=1 Tax=Pseudomonas sp. Leaf129 TaxID=1736268 RepID=UPI000703563E|nr:hypothetical protein [Pseudomonas sp. Leaf129]KQQ62958.1 hypothetical protein ASF66_00975 [Pseudomonas sp. Leaf129]
MKSRQQQTDAFKVKSESGKVYDMIEITHQTYHEFLNPADNKWADGLKQFKVAGGGNANRQSDTEFEIVSTGELVTRV